MSRERRDVHEIGRNALVEGRVLEALAQSLAVKVRGALTRDASARAVEAVYAARATWVADFEGSQSTLGRAYYTHLEQGRARAYFEGAAAADAAVEGALPGMQAQLRDLLASVVGEAVTRRRGWCGPGVHVFPAGHWVARHGGSVHFDTEGLTAAQRAVRAPAITAVLMIQPPDHDGALRVWDRVYDGERDDDDRHDERATRGARAVDVTYDAGDLVLIDSYRLHQIRPFAGTRDRVSVTAHAARAFGVWESWF